MEVTREESGTRAREGGKPEVLGRQGIRSGKEVLPETGSGGWMQNTGAS